MLQIESTVVMDQCLVRITCIHHGAPSMSHELSQTWFDCEALPGTTRKRWIHAAASLALQDLAFGAWASAEGCSGD